VSWVQLRGNLGSAFDYGERKLNTVLRCEWVANIGKSLPSVVHAFIAVINYRRNSCFGKRTCWVLFPFSELQLEVCQLGLKKNLKNRRTLSSLKYLLNNIFSLLTWISMSVKAELQNMWTLVKQMIAFHFNFTRVEGTEVT